MTVERLRERSHVWSTLLFVSLMAAALSGCSGENGDGHSPGSTLAPGTPNAVGSGTKYDPNDPNLIRVAMKYVALQSAPTGNPKPSRAEVETLSNNMSDLWSQCDIVFVFEEYISPVASDYGLDYTPANHYQLDQMRSAFADSNRALFIKTGTWDRSGDLGYDGSNAFSTMPGSNPDGVAVEEWAGISSLLLAHEAGHLLGGLGHTGSTTNLMNHFVTSQTTKLNDSQCNEARSTVKDYYSAWLR